MNLHTNLDLTNGVDIDTALDKAQADIIKDMKNSSFQSVENLYEFAK